MLIAPPGKLSAVYEWQLQSSSFTIYQCFLWHTPKANHHFSLVFNVTLLPILQTSRAHKEIIFGFECLFIVLQCSLIHCVTPLCYIRRHGSLLKQRSKKVCRARREVRNVTTNPFQLSTKHPRFKPRVCPGEKPIAPLIFIISIYTRNPISSWWPSATLLALRACLTSSFTPCGHSSRVLLHVKGGG